MISAVHTLPSHYSHYEIDNTERIQVVKSLTHQPPKGGTPWLGYSCSWKAVSDKIYIFVTFV